MYAPKNPIYRWEKQNEELLLSLAEEFFSFAKLVLKKSLILLSALTFIFYKLIVIAGLSARTAFLSSPMVQIPKEESWLYRQIK